MRGLIHDLRSGVRPLARARLFSVAAISVLALGLGASSAVFVLFDALLLRPLDVRDPETPRQPG